jgi:hypothetical protein
MNTPSNPSPTVKGTIRQVLPSIESAFYVTVIIAIENPTSRPASIARYRIEWPGGYHIGPARPLELAVGESRDWRVRVNPDSGDLTALLDHPEAARFVILDVRP